MVTGKPGQLARALVAEKPPGVQLVALSREELDITDRAAIDAMVASFRPQVIINCAAYTAVDRAEREEGLAYAVNGQAPGALAAAAARTGARLVQISTDYVFGGTCAVRHRRDDPVEPCNVYGASKAAGEDRVRGILPDALIVRTAWLYGAGGNNFVMTMLRLLAEREHVGVVADQYGSPTHARSLARMLWRLVDREATGIWHATDAGAASWYDFAIAIQEEALTIGLLSRGAVIEPITTSDYPTPASRPRFSILDPHELWREIDLPPQHWRHELRVMLKELRRAEL